MSLPPLHAIALLELRQLLAPLLQAARDRQIIGPDPAIPFATGLYDALEEMDLADRLPGDLTQTLGPVADRIEAAATAVKARAGGSDDLAAIVDLVLQVEDVIDALRDLADGSPGTADATEIAGAVWSWLAWRRVRTLSPAVEALGEALGIVVPAEEGRAGRFDAGQLRRILVDPEAALRDAVGWGDTLAVERVLDALEQVARELGVPATLALRATGLPDMPNEVVLRLRLAGDGVTAEAGLIVAADDPLVPRGLEVTAYGTGSLAVDRMVGRRGIAQLTMDGAAEAAPRLTISPAGVVAEGVVAGTRGRSALTIGWTGADDDPLVLLPLGKLGAVTTQRVQIMAAAGWGGEASGFGVSVEGGIVRIGGGELDGFLARILPSSGIKAPFDLSLRWSAAKGLTVEGQAGLTLDTPLAVDLFGAVSLERLVLTLQPTDTPSLSARLNVAGKLGPLAVAVTGIGLRLEGNVGAGAMVTLGGYGIQLGLLRPTGLGLSLDLGVLRGGGYFDVEDHRYAGALALEAGDLSLAAFGLIETQLPGGRDGFSMLAFVSGQFAPVQLGFGFTLLGVGGLMGINRDLDPDALFDAVRAGTAGDLLASTDPVREAPRLIALAEGIFPARAGQHVFGPTMRVGWGTPTLLTLDLALAATLPEPLRLVLIGRLVGAVPAPELPIVKINLDLAGMLDITGGRLELEGRLHDSSIQAIPVQGGFALRSAWKGSRALVFSIGGLHPGFEPPPRFPDIDRMGTSLTRGGALRLTMGGYFAITSNTLQIGARVDLKVSAAGFTLLGELGFDALVEFDPFRMQLDIRAGVQVMRGRRSLFRLTFKGRLSGPNPWRVKGYAIIEIPILPDVKVSASATFGSERSVPSEPVDLGALVADALGKPEAFAPASPPETLVLAQGAQGRLAPTGQVELRQQVAPLGHVWEHFHGKPLEAARRVRISGITAKGGSGERVLTLGAELTEPFPPQGFVQLNERARLSAPSFEDLTAGVTLSSDGLDAQGTAAPKRTARETVVIGPNGRKSVGAMPEIAFDPRVDPPPQVAVIDDAWLPADLKGRSVGPATSWMRARSLASGDPILAAEAA